jgi:TonB-linked SusC/RagA family outer membrane protein
MALFSFSLYAQENVSLTISGSVTDDLGEAVIGAGVYIKDRISVGTTTDVDGKFTIKATKGDKIIVAMVGFDKYEYLVMEEKRDLSVVMKGHILEEVVITALGQKERKISTVASLSTVEVKDLQRPVTSVANLLGGRVAGIISTQMSGEPGKNIAEFWVRGIGTFGYNQGALVLIDGLEGDINSIDPADVESFSILKDASATAVYGVRGANGVVLVTTKRGEAQKLNITGRVSMTVSHLSRVPEYLRAYDYANLVNEALEVRGETPRYGREEMYIIQDHLDPDLYPDVNWQDEILNRNSIKNNYFISGRGGGEIARYYLSIGGSNESAAYKVDKESPYASNVGYNTYNYRMNLDINLTKTTVAYFGTDGFLSIHDEPGVANTDYIWQAQSSLNPLLIPVIYSNGEYPGIGEKAGISPSVMINRTGSRSDQVYKGKMTLALNQDLGMLLKGLKIRAQGSYDIYSYFNESRYVQPSLLRATGRNALGELQLIEMLQEMPATYSNGKDQFRKYHFESTLNYEQIFNADHRVGGLVYYYINDQKQGNQIGNLESIPLRYQGVSSRLTYGFRDTYLLDFNFGYSGSENFQPGHQYGFFPAIALGWVPTSYDFVRDNISFLSFLKFRASYGTVGNDQISGATRFPYLTRMNFGTTGPWNSAVVESISERIIGADNLRWEEAIKANLGIDMHLWKDKFTLTVDFFNDERDGIFQQRVQIPDFVGAVNMPYGNVGRMRSFGSDGTGAFTHNFNNDMGLTIRGNFTYANNKILNWEDVNQAYPYIEKTGYPYGILRGYRSLGFFTSEEEIQYSPKQFGTLQPGDIKYKDVNGDGKISDEDMVPLSYGTMPRLMYGMGGEFRYKDITLGILFRGTGRTDFYHVGQTVNNELNGMGYVPFYQGETGNVLTLVNDPKNRWIPMDYALAHGIDPALAENPNALFPKLQYGYNENNSQLSDFWKGDARYLRLQEITLNYNLKNLTLKKIGLSSIDIQLVGSNLFIWDKVKIFDPEQASRNGQAYPIPATYTIQLYLNM